MASHSEQTDLCTYVESKLRAAKGAAVPLALASSAAKNAALDMMAEALWDARESILQANAADVESARQDGASPARVDRLRLTEERIGQMMNGLREIIDLDDPVGTIIETIHRPNGLEISKVSVPMGVIAMIYEARPNVTVDAAGLSIKTGNAIVLRGGREALQSNRALVAALHQGLSAAGFPTDAVQLIERTEHESVDLIIKARGLVDLAIPRGGAGLITRVVNEARVPVIETGVGNCHIYVDEAADLNKALAITMNAKVQRPSVCNAAESLLVHRSVAGEFIPMAAERLLEAGVLIHACPETMEILRHHPMALGQHGAAQQPNQGGAGEAGLGPQAGFLETRIVEATEEDYATEYLALEISIKVVDSVDDAMEHIARYGTGHSEAIVTENVDTAERFLATIDAAAVYHNASTRFTDGFEFGYGAEIGISTQKLHARGPMGLREITTYKYIVRGSGQVRS